MGLIGIACKCAQLKLEYIHPAHSGARLGEKEDAVKGESAARFLPSTPTNANNAGMALSAETR